MLSQDMIEKVLDRASEKGADFAEVFEETDFLATPIGAGTVIVSCTTNPS